MSSNEEVSAIKVSYTDADVADAAKRDKWAEGTYRAVLADIKKDISKDNGHLMLVCTYRALRDPDDAGSIFGFAIKYWQCLPFRNPNRDGHQPKKFFAQSTNRWLSAHFPDDVLALPYRSDEGLVFKGEVIENADEEAAKKEAYDTSYGKADELWNDESNEAMEAMKGSAVYFDLYYAKDKDSGQVSDFPSLQNFSSELGSRELIDPSVALTGVVSAPAEEEEVAVKPKTNGHAKNGKTNGKVAAKVAVKPAKRK